MVSKLLIDHYSNVYTLCIGAVAIDGSTFTGSTFKSFISSVACNGNENNLFSCPLDSSAVICGGKAKAGIVCQGNKYFYTTCLIFTLRLTSEV